LARKKEKPRYLFIAFLLVLLAVTAGLTFFVFRNADNIVLPHGKQAGRWEDALPGKEERPSATSERAGETGPGWRGVASVSKLEEGGHRLVITPVDARTGTVPLTSFQVYLRGLKDEKEEDITALFAKDTRGNLTASLEGKGKGPWLLRARLHRELSTLEFTQRIDLP